MSYEYKVSIRHLVRGWQADMIDPETGVDHHAIGDTPEDALLELAIYWRGFLRLEARK